MPLLEVNNLSKNFGGLDAVVKLSFNIKNKEVVGLIGPNGAGKTTLFNLINGFLHVSSGQITYKNENITDSPSYRICKRGIARTFQHPKVVKTFTVFDNIKAGAYNRYKRRKEAEKKAEEVIKVIGMEDSYNSLANDLNLLNQKRIELGRALATLPNLILIDEIMAGLNPTETEEMVSLLKKLAKIGYTLFIIEHKIKAIMSLSDRIIVLHHGGKIAEGKPKEIVEDENVVKAYLGAGTHTFS